MEKKIVDMIIEAYVKIEGDEKWNSLSAKQQHDVIMTIVKDANKAIDTL